MGKKQRVGLVVDASVAKAAGGEDKRDMASSTCSRFLRTMAEKGFLLVWTREIADEWNRHQSIFSKKWRSRMYAKKMVLAFASNELSSLESQIAQCVFAAEAERDALTKDKHLLEAALASDKRVVSQDEKARAPARTLAASCAMVRDILWINPAFSAETPIQWLQACAPMDAHRLLGHQAR